MCRSWGILSRFSSRKALPQPTICTHSYFLTLQKCFFPEVFLKNSIEHKTDINVYFFSNLLIIDIIDDGSLKFWLEWWKCVVHEFRHVLPHEENLTSTNLSAHLNSLTLRKCFLFSFLSWSGDYVIELTRKHKIIPKADFC